MFKSYKKKKLAQALAEALSNPFGVTTLKKIQTVGFLFNGDAPLDVTFSEKMLKAIKVSGSQASVLSFVTFHKKAPPLTEAQCSNKDFSWKGTITASKINTFTQQEFDLLVCYYEGEHDYLDLITAKSNAKFKIGLSSKSDVFFDLMIAVKASNGDAFIAEVKKYLTILGKI